MFEIKEQREGWVVNRDSKAVDPLFTDLTCNTMSGVYTFLETIGVQNVQGFYVWGDCSIKGIPAARWMANYEDYLKSNR